MDYGDYITYYVGLFTIQITLATIIAAGILAWYQLTEKQIPKRSISKVVRPWTLAAYFAISVFVVIATGLMTWSLLGEHDIFPWYDFKLTLLAVSPLVTLVYITFTVLLVLYFFYILWRSRNLIDVKRYLRKVADGLDYSQLSDYLFNKYSYRPLGHIQISWIGAKRTKEEKREEEDQEAKANQDIKDWEERYEKTKLTKDPIEPIIEYCRANATTASSDVERIGLPLLAEVLGKAVADQEHNNIEYVTHYIEDITNDMVEALESSPVMIKKRFIDVIYIVAVEYCNRGDHETMVNVAKKMHVFTRGIKNESLKIYAISKLEQLVGTLKEKTEGAEDWRDIYLPMEGLLMVGARIGENYYHNIPELAPVSIIENNNSEVDDLTSVLGNFMYRMSDLHRKYPDAIPVIYFDSLYVISLALQSAMVRSAAVQKDLGLTRSKYEQAVTSSDFTFYDHARTAIRSENEELLKASVYNLLKLLDNMSSLGMYEHMIDSIDTLVRLGAHVETSKWAKHQSSYGGVAIIDQIVSKILSYPNQSALLERKSSIEHDMFDIQFKDGYDDFMSRIGW